MLEYLSGNVPGGIFVYLLVVITLFLALYSSSRRNDLFTPAQFRWWFAGIWLFLTALYAGFWLRNPPAAVLSRYAVAVHVESPYEWRGQWLREEIESLLPAYKDQSTYLYTGRQLPGAGILTSPEDIERWQRQVSALRIENAIVVTLKRSSSGWHLALKALPQNHKKLLPAEITLNFDNIASFQEDFRNWVSAAYQLPSTEISNGNLPDSLFMTAKVLFRSSKYQKSINLCVKARQRWPEHNEITRLINFNRIRLAGKTRVAEGPRNPFDHEPREWQRQLQEARAALIILIKDNIEDNIEDPQLTNMMAESFIQEELFVEAQEFLNLAYAANPFDAEVLENLSLLHPSRYKSLGFSSETELLLRILDLYPAHVATLSRYVERELLSVPVKEAATENSRKRLNHALKLNPDSPEILLLQGKFLLAVFQYQQALDTFARADSLQPENAITHYNMGICAFKLDDLPQAEAYFKKAIELEDYLDAHLYLGVIYQRNEQFQKALTAFRYRVANKTGDNDYYALQAMKGIRECLEALNIPIPQY